MGSYLLRSSGVYKLPDSRNTFDMCRTNGTQPTSLRGAEWNKRVEEGNGSTVEGEKKKEVAMEGMEVVEEKVVEEASKMVRWGSSPDSANLEHC